MQPNSEPPEVPVSSVRPETPDDMRLSLEDVPPGAVLKVEDVTVFHVPHGFCATQSRCTHRQGPLSEGKLDGETVTCPWHGAQFNVCTGAVLRGPATDPLKTYEVLVEGDDVRVKSA